MSTDLTTITPSDTVQQAGSPFAAIYVGVGGDVAAATLSDGVAGAVVFKAVPSNSWLSFPGAQFAWVKATGTTATNMVGMHSKSDGPVGSTFKP